jgi:hypothetical protein
MYENYLLDVEAVADCLDKATMGARTPIEPRVVNNWLQVNGVHSRFLGNQHPGTTVFSVEWYTHVDGARLLRAIFADLTESAVEYRKTTHSLELTTWLLANKPSVLSGLAVFVRATFQL